MNKEPTNLAYLKKWKEGIEKMVPPTQTQFDSKYPTYTLARSRIADLQRTDVQSHRDLLDVYRQRSRTADTAALHRVALVQATTDALAQYGDGHEGVRRWRRCCGAGQPQAMTEPKKPSRPKQLIKADFERAGGRSEERGKRCGAAQLFYSPPADRLNDLQRPTTTR